MNWKAIFYDINLTGAPLTEQDKTRVMHKVACRLMDQMKWETSADGYEIRLKLGDHSVGRISGIGFEQSSTIAQVTKAMESLAYHSAYNLFTAPDKLFEKIGGSAALSDAEKDALLPENNVPSVYKTDPPKTMKIPLQLGPSGMVKFTNLDKPVKWDDLQWHCESASYRPKAKKPKAKS